MRALLTGGTGFIGANLARALLEQGRELICSARASSPTLTLEGLPLQRRELDLFDVEALLPQLEGVEEVYHLAGSFDPSPGGEERMRRIHVDATRALCEASLRAGVRRLLLCSSSITVGFGDRRSPGDEETPLDPDQLYGRRGPLRAYHDTKLEAEALVREYPARGLEVVIVNPDYILGPWDVKPTSGAMVLAMARRGVPVYPQGGKCFQTASDCARGHILAMERGRVGERYLLGSWNLSYREFLTLTAEVVGRRPPRLPLPRRALGLLGRAGALLQRVDTHRFAGLDGKVLQAMSQSRYRSDRKAREELGLEPEPIRQGIEAAWRWFLEQGYC